MARSLSLGTKLAAAISGVLAVVAIAAGLELAKNSRRQLVEGKRTATTMVVDLFAASIAPALDFGDEDSMKTELDKLASNPDLVQASLWKSDRKEAVLQFSRQNEVPPGGRPMHDEAHVGPDAIRITRHLAGRDGTSLGSLAVVFSLEPENARFLEARRNIFAATALFAALTAAVMVAISRHIVLKPVLDLSRAARRLERGDWQPVLVKSRDELGQLGTAFNTMANAIVDREQRLADLNERLQELLDHMRQAIVVFGDGGVLEDVRSRRVETTFERADLAGVRVQDLLYSTSDNELEAAAFDEWIRATFSLSADAWDQLAALAPKEVVLSQGTPRERVLSLDFRPIRRGGKIERVMMLASDETEKRRLERTVKAQDEEHERQIAAMRRLVAGGGQLLVSVLDRARERLRYSDELVAAEGEWLTPTLVEQLFQHAHSVKGEARAFDLAVLESASAELEDYLAILRGRLRERQQIPVDDVRGSIDERIAVTREALDKAAEMLVQASPIGKAILEQTTVRRADVLRLLELAGKRNDEIGKAVARVASRPFGESLLGLVDAVPRWAEREGKRARVEVQGRSVPVPPDLAGLLPDLLTHLVRNALAHGIETSIERAGSGKHEIGTIVAACREGDRGPVITVQDDGAGVDAERVLAAAEELGLSQRDAASVEDLVFHQGLSTASTTALMAGRGVGLGAVRADLRAICYRVHLESSPGKGTRVILEPSEARAAA